MFVWVNSKVSECLCRPTEVLLKALNNAIVEIKRLDEKGVDFESKEFLDSVNKVVEGAGFKLLGVGGTRLVYEFKDDSGCDCVVKVARTSDATMFNRNDVDVMMEVPDDIRDLFLPVGAADEEGWWVTQPKADLPEEKTRAKIVRQIRAKLRSKGWKCYNLGEDNVGLYKGKPVVIDYGFGISCEYDETYIGEVSPIL